MFLVNLSRGGDVRYSLTITVIIRAIHIVDGELLTGVVEFDGVIVRIIQTHTSSCIGRIRSKMVIT